MMETSGWSKILSYPLESLLERAFPSSPSRSPDIEIHHGSYTDSLNQWLWPGLRFRVWMRDEAYELR